jgi:hypothetical protein
MAWPISSRFLSGSAWTPSTFNEWKKLSTHGRVSRRDLPPQLLTEPYVNLSAHTALVIQRSISKFASEQTATVIDDTTLATTFLISSYDASEAYVFALPTS